MKGELVIVDGVHRCQSREKAGFKAIMVEDLGPMTPAEAFQEAVRCNAIHGKPLTKTERADAYRKLINQYGIGIKQAELTLSVKSDEIRKWSTSTMKNVHSGDIIRKFDKKALRWRITEIKSIINSGLNGDEDVHKRLLDLSENIDRYLEIPPAFREKLQQLGSLINRMTSRHSPEVHEQLMELSDLIKKTTPKP